MEKMKKTFFRKNIVLLALLVIANVIFYSVCYFSSKISMSKTTVTTISGLSFNNITDKPLSVDAKLPSFYKAFNIEFESDFRPSNDNYRDVFQTGSEPKNLRLELMPASSMQLIIGYKDDHGVKIFPISKKVKMNAWNHIKLTYSVDKKVYVKLNDEPFISFQDSKYDAVINDLVLGTGFDKQRMFQGLIKNARFKIVYIETSILFYFLGLLSRLYLALVFFQLLCLYLYVKYNRWQSIKTKEREHNDVFLGFLLSFSVLAFVLLLTGILSSPLTSQRKWIPYLSLLIPIFAISMNYLKIEILSKRYFLVIAGVISFIVLALGILTYEPLSWVGISGVIIAGCCFSVIPLMKYFSFVFVWTFIFLFSINSVVFINNYGTQNYIWTVLAVLAVIWAVLFSLFEQNLPTRWTRANKIGFAVLLINSFIFALRSDSLFLGSAEFHWNYYTGVIQTIRSGGELLWSAPSQYGLLNILIPSLLPWTSRASFYIFQAVLFFIVTFIIIKTIYISFKHNASFILISLASLSLFYFADPALIGPALYPSSSAMRFFWVYILIYAILLEYQRRNLMNGGIKWLVAAAYILGSLWSAESMLYCTAIYSTYLFITAVSISKLRINSAFMFLLKNISVVFIAWIVINFTYLIITSHFPDWSMYFMYAFGYANGFGEQVIKPGGTYWAVILGLSSIIFISARLYSSRKYNEWIVSTVCSVSLWALTSYYVGRAVTNNLTAILPVIFYIFIVMLSVLMNSKFFTYRLLLNAVFLPWIIVGIIGGIGNPRFIEELQSFKFAEDINAKSFKPDKDLGNILESLQAIKGTRIVYHGAPYNNPVIPGKKGRYQDILAGMPMPLTLLEEPIPENKKAIIVERFLSKLNEPVFLIRRKSEPNTSFPVWKRFLEQKYYIEKKEIKSVNYEVFIVRRK